MTQKFISHRGNLNGRNIATENHPKQIEHVLNLGIDCEIDVWYKNGRFLLGHDIPQFKVDVDFLQQKGLWCHAKNIDALLKMSKKDIHFFWHENDKLTLTSQGYIWAYPNKIGIKNSIAVLPEIYKTDISQCYGVCCDNFEGFNLNIV